MISIRVFPDSEAKDSGLHKQFFCGFRNSSTGLPYLANKYFFPNCASCNEHFCLWNRESWALGSVIQLTESRQQLESGIQIPLTKTPKSSIWNPASMAWNPESKTVLGSNRGEDRWQFTISLRGSFSFGGFARIHARAALERRRELEGQALAARST